MNKLLFCKGIGNSLFSIWHQSILAQGPEIYKEISAEADRDRTAFDTQRELKLLTTNYEAPQLTTACSILR